MSKGNSKNRVSKQRQKSRGNNEKDFRLRAKIEHRILVSRGNYNISDPIVGYPNGIRCQLSKDRG